MKKMKNNKKCSRHEHEVYNVIAALYGQVDKMPRNRVSSIDASALKETYGPDWEESYKRKAVEYWNEQSRQSDKKQDS